MFGKVFDTSFVAEWTFKKTSKLQRMCQNFAPTINGLISSVTSKKSPNVYKSCPKMISLEN